MHVATIETRPETTGGREALTTVRASVHLGALTPADVNVVLVAGGDAAVTNPMHEGTPLWCDRAYGNGIYVYEGDVPRAMLEGGDACAVRIVPDRYRLLTAIPPVVHRAKVSATDRPGPRRSGESVAPLDVAQEPEVRSRRDRER
ncbi:MAG: hypothetical protein IRY91_02200 [Gemmatimonadaceae bacterium]|nr:hypothetical protein [Gemmatimonadaceae bacterium]